MISKNNISGKIPTIRKTNDKNDIQNLIPSKLNCSIFSVYDCEGMTIQEILCAFFTKINECIEHVNKTLDLVEWLVEVGLKEEVATQLKEWLDDGTLAEIIGDLFDILTSKIDGIEKKMPVLETKVTNIEKELPKLDTRIKDIEKLNCNIFATDTIEKINTKIADTKYNKYIFHSGEYHVTKDNYIKIHRDNIEIDFLPNSLIVQDDFLESLYVMIEIRKCKNVILNNPKLDGKMPSYTPPNTEEGAPEQWGYGIEITRAQNVKVIGADIRNTTGDGFYLGFKWDEGVEEVQDVNDNILIESFTINRASRNGISICGGYNTTIRNGKITNITRCEPKSGIDIEPENGNSKNLKLDNLIISNIYIENTDKSICALIEVPKGGNVTINNITSIGSTSSLALFGWNCPLGRLSVRGIDVIKPRAYVMNFGTVFNYQNISISDISVSGKLELPQESQIPRNSMFYFNTESLENVGGITISNLNYQCVAPYKYLMTAYFEKGKWNNITFSAFNGTELPPIYNAPFENKTFRLVDTIILDDNILNRKYLDLRSLVNKMQFEWDLIENAKIDFMHTIPDGEYEIGYNINTGGHSFQIALDEKYQVFLNGVRYTENNIITTKPIMLLKFIKSGTLLNIKSFFPLQ